MKTLIKLWTTKSTEPHRSECWDEGHGRKPNGKAPISSGNNNEVMFFRDVTVDPHEAEIRFRLIHFWEAQNPSKNTLIGLEMLMIDEQGTVMKGFVTPGRIDKFLPHLKQGCVYSLFNFYGSHSKLEYCVVAQNVTVSFSHQSVLLALENSPVAFDEDRFRFHTYEDFEANCDLKWDLYDFVGHMKLVSGRNSIDETELENSRRILVHIQSHEGPVMKLYLWDQAAAEFCRKFNSSESPPTVLLVTTVNTKRFRGTLTLSSMASSRVFMDNDVQPTKEYLAWLGCNPDIANQVKAEVVTKKEALSIGEIFTYMKHESAKEAYFECTATIDDVFQGSGWYYIGCGGCKTKATKGPSSLMCSKCGKNDVTGVAQFLSKITVYDKGDEAVFVILGDAGHELTGKHAAELVSSFYEANGSKSEGFEVPISQVLLNTIGQTHKFVVKVSERNLTGQTRALTVTKILPPPAPAPADEVVEDPITPPAEHTSVFDDDVVEVSNSCEGSVGDDVKRRCDGVAQENTKRLKHSK